jgi:threonine synthase
VNGALRRVESRPRQPFVLTETPLVASRSLGALLGLGALHFKVETGQPTGSWVDRCAAEMVRSAQTAGATGLATVGVGPLTLPLAVQCARTGLRLMVLEDAQDVQQRGWLAMLGARVVTVEARLGEVWRAAPEIAARSGLYLMDVSSPVAESGLRQLVHEIEVAGHGADLLVVTALTGDEQVALMSLADRRDLATPLPLDGFGEAGQSAGPPFGVVGSLAIGEGGNGGSAEATTVPPDASVLAVEVSARQAEAARCLLAREEGLLTSRQGAVGLAALVRSLREDRAQRPRERRLPRDVRIVVVLTGDPLGTGGEPPRAADAVSGRPVSLAALVADPCRLLVDPPGRWTGGQVPGGGEASIDVEGGEAEG